MRQRLFSREQPEGQDQPLRQTLIDRVQGLPFFAPVQLYLDTLERMRAWWPVLLPVLAWVAWRTYHEERANLAADTTRTA